MKTPTVSVCVPTYNGSAYLAETLASISAQTFGDFEIVIVDDGSKDDTVEIAERFAATERRARVVRNAERAGSSARNANKCLDHARGEWIKFLFQDDLMAPTCLERMIEAARRGRFAFVWHGYLFAPNTDASTKQYYESLPTLSSELPGDYATPDAFSDAVLRNWQVNFVGPTSASFIHRGCFDAYGRFSPDITSLPDLEQWIRVGSHEGLAIAPEQLVTFRVHNRSVSGAIRNDEIRAFAGLLDTVVLAVNLARAPEYARLRARAPLIERPFDPDLAARAAVFDVRWVAIDARYRQRDNRQHEMWKRFCAEHPVVADVVRELDASRSLWSRAKEALKARL